LTDEVSTPDESVDDSPVIRALRQQIKDLKEQVKNVPSRESIEAEVRTKLERTSALSAQLVALGHPAGLAALLEGQLGEAEVTRESVVQLLEGIGYQVAVDDASSEEGTQPAAGLADLAKVSTLSAQVASTVKGGNQASVLQRIAEAQTPAELAAIAAQEGFLSS
jgi:hypothetical protein